MLADEIIEPAASEWVSNVVLTLKNEGSMKFYIDYRGIYEKTNKDSYLLPRCDEWLDALSGVSWYSALNLRSG